jgi:hypothetical protein
MAKWPAKAITAGALSGLTASALFAASSLLIVYLRDDLGWEDQMARSSRFGEWWTILLLIRLVPLFIVALLLLIVLRKKLRGRMLADLSFDLLILLTLYALAGLVSDRAVVELLKRIQLTLSGVFYALALTWTAVIMLRVHAAVQRTG